MKTRRISRHTLTQGQKAAAVLSALSFALAGAAASDLSATTADDTGTMGGAVQTLSDEGTPLLASPADAIPTEAMDTASISDPVFPTNEAAPGSATSVDPDDSTLPPSDEDPAPEALLEAKATAGQSEPLPNVPDNATDAAGEGDEVPPQVAPAAPENAKPQAGEQGAQTNHRDATATALEGPMPSQVAPQAAERTFAIKKVVEGGPAFATTKDYRFYWRCGETSSKQIVVKGNGIPKEVRVPNPAGTKCQISEESTVAHLPGYVLIPPDAVELTLTDGSTPVAEFVNKYSDTNGSFKVKKIIEGGTEDLKTREYEFFWTCTDPTGAKRFYGQIAAGGDGTAAVADKLIPAGWTCTVVEEPFSLIDTGQAGILPPAQTLTIVEDEYPTLEFTNKFSTESGTFKLKATVKNGPPEAANKDFAIAWECDGAWGQKSVKGDGSVVEIPGSFRPGTKCTVKQLTDDLDLDPWLIKMPPAQNITIENGTAPVLEFANVLTDQVGKITVAKTVSAAPPAAKNLFYEFYLDCEGHEYSISVRGNGEDSYHNLTLPAGTKCTVYERNLEKPIQGYISLPPNAQTVQVEAGKTTAVRFTNTFTNRFGTLKLHPHVVGLDLFWWELGLPVRVECGGSTFNVWGATDMPGPTVLVPAGTKCKLTPWLEPNRLFRYTVFPPPAQEVTVKQDETTDIDLPYVITDQFGAFAVKKTVTGGPSFAANHDYKFNWKCGEESGVITAKGDGTAVETGDVFPVDTVCEISEDAASAAIEGYTLTPPAAQTVTIVADQTIELTFNNAYTQNSVPPTDEPTHEPTHEPTDQPTTPPLTTPPTTKPPTTVTPDVPQGLTPTAAAPKEAGGKLARTGSDAGVVGLLALGLLASGAALLLLRRRRS